MLFFLFVPKYIIVVEQKNNMSEAKSNIVISDLEQPALSYQKDDRCESPSKRSRWLKKGGAKKQPAYYRVQKVFNILERQGLAEPMDVRCQFDVNRQVYKMLRNLGIDEVTYPVPNDDSFEGVAALSLRALQHSVNPNYPLYEAESRAEKREIIPKRRRTLGVIRSSSKESFGNRVGRKTQYDIPKRRQSVGSQPLREKDCLVMSLPREWGDVITKPGKVVTRRLNVPRKHRKSRNDETLSLVENFRDSFIPNTTSGLTPLSAEKERVQSFLMSEINSEDFLMSLEIPSAVPQKSYLNYRCMHNNLADEEENFTDVKDSQSDPDKNEGDCVTTNDDGRISRTEFCEVITAMRMLDREGSAEVKNKPNNSGAEGNILNENVWKLENPVHLSTKIRKSNMRARNLKPDPSEFVDREKFSGDSVTEIHVNSDEGFGQRQSVVREQSKSSTAISASKTRRRVSWAPELDGDNHVTLPQPSSRRERRTDSPKDFSKNRTNKPQTPTHSESETSLLCLRYL